MKKLVSLLLVLTMVLGLSMTALASDNTFALTLEKNEYNSNGERHIKAAWTGKSGTYQIQLDDDKDFKSPISKKTKNKFWNFVLKENVDATYYIRVRLGNGAWSDVVVASMDAIEESKGNAYFSVPALPSIPNISGGVKLPQLKISGIKVPVLKLK